MADAFGKKNIRKTGNNTKKTQKREMAMYIGRHEGRKL